MEDTIHHILGDSNKVLVYWNGTCCPVFSKVNSRGDVRDLLSFYNIYYKETIEKFGGDDEMLRAIDDDAIDSLNKYEQALVNLEKRNGGRADFFTVESFNQYIKPVFGFSSLQDFEEMWCSKVDYLLSRGLVENDHNNGYLITYGGNVITDNWAAYEEMECQKNKE